MAGGKGDDIGIRSPSVTYVVATLTALYACICGLCSLCPGPTSVLLCVVLFLAKLMAGARTLDARHPSVPYLLCLTMLTAFTASLVGIRNYHAAYFPYLAAKEGRTYTDIAPTAKATPHLDGGLISFADGTRLAADQSVGLRLNGVAYCAAPILGPAPAGAASAAAAPVQFFAIGEGCCGSRGDFTCDDVADSTARGGIVWHELSEGALSTRLFAPTSRRREYMKAVQASMALSGQEAAEQPVLLRWVANPHHLLVMWLTYGLLAWILSSVLYGFFVAILWFLVDHHFDKVLKGMKGSLSDAMTDLRPPPPETKPQTAASRFGLWRSSTPRSRQPGTTGQV